MRIPSSRTSRKRRKVIALWYEHLGPYCVYCGIEMIDTAEAFEIDDRNGENRRLFSKQERRHSHNHPTIDHIVPRARGGSSMLKNLVVACKSCNHSKDDAAPQPIHEETLIAWYQAIDNYLAEEGKDPYPNPEGIHQNE